MNQTEARPSTDLRVRHNEIPTMVVDHNPVLVRPATKESRAQAIQNFESEFFVSAKPAAVARPGVATLLFNAEILLSAGERSQAQHLIRQALCLDSRHPEALKKMMKCLGHREEERRQKVAILKTLVQVEATFENFARLGQELLDNRDLDGALEAFFESTLRVEEENNLLFEVHKNMGNIFVRKGDFDSAEESYHKAFTLQPDSDVLQVNLGTLAVQKDDWGKALERFRKCLELNPKNDKGWVGVALCHHQVGDSYLALATLENALDLCPSNRTAVHLMANWCLPTGPVDRSIERLQDYLATQESDVEMSLVLIHLLCLRQQFLLAELELERALCWEPTRHDLIELRTKLSKSASEAQA